MDVIPWATVGYPIHFHPLPPATIGMDIYMDSMRWHRELNALHHKKHMQIGKAKVHEENVLINLESHEQHLEKNTAKLGNYRRPERQVEKKFWRSISLNLI